MWRYFAIWLSALHQTSKHSPDITWHRICALAKWLGWSNRSKHYFTFCLNEFLYSHSKFIRGVLMFQLLWPIPWQWNQSTSQDEYDDARDDEEETVEDSSNGEPLSTSCSKLGSCCRFVLTAIINLCLINEINIGDCWEAEYLAKEINHDL